MTSTTTGIKSFLLGWKLPSAFDRSTNLTTPRSRRYNSILWYGMQVWWLLPSVLDFFFFLCFCAFVLFFSSDAFLLWFLFCFDFIINLGVSFLFVSFRFDSICFLFYFLAPDNIASVDSFGAFCGVTEIAKVGAMKICGDFERFVVCVPRSSEPEPKQHRPRVPYGTEAR